jgi:hypothetical protein
VLDCTDASIPEDESCFVRNPSLEGTPTVGLGDLGEALPDWSVCSATPDVNPLFASVQPTDGDTYLGAVAGTTDALVEAAGGTLCTPLEAGATVSFSVDVAVSSYLGNPGRLELWGGASSCSRDELLWTSPTLTEVDTWQTFCITASATRDLSHVIAWPVPDSLGGAYVLVDNFRLESSCP